MTSEQQHAAASDLRNLQSREANRISRLAKRGKITVGEAQQMIAASRAQMEREVDEVYGINVGEGEQAQAFNEVATVSP